MHKLRLQEKIVLRLQSPFSVSGHTHMESLSYLTQTQTGNIVQRCKDWAQSHGWVGKMKRIPLLGPGSQWLYHRLIRDKHSIDVADLLRFDGVDFITELYHAILYREPDPTGMQTLLNAVQSGVEKKKIICDFLQTEEACRMPTRITGLDVTIWKYKIKRILKSLGPLSIGLSWMYKLWTLPKRFYALARSVQDLLYQFDQVKQAVLEMTGSNKRQQQQTVFDATAVREKQNALIDRIRNIEEQLLANPKRSGVTLLQRPNYRPIDYFMFEEKFRGARSVIKQRQKDYLEFVQTAWKHTSAEFIDLGCGRGEFIELLTEHRIAVRGVDLDAKNVVYCQSLGMQVECNDALSALQKQPNESLAGIVAFQVVEHLEPDYLNELVMTAFEKLCKGGCVIFETINPYSFYSLRSFFLDLSHKKPLPPETLQYLLEHAGFTNTRFHFICPVEDHQKLQENDENTRKLNQILFGYQEYAIIGIK